MRNLHQDIMKMQKASPRLTAVVDVMQQAAATIADLKLEIADKEKEILKAAAKAEALKAEIALIKQQNIEKSEAPSPAYNSVMEILKTKYK